jgi:hypothetical protein
MFPYQSYLLHEINEGFVCTLCGSQVPVKIQKRTRTKYAWETVYVENVNNGDRAPETEKRKVA